MATPADAEVRNRRATERLSALASTPDAALGIRAIGEWTVSATLAHLAFWDGVAHGVLVRWTARAESRLDVPSWHDDLVNDAMLNLALAVPPAEAARQALAAALTMDAALAGLSGADAERLLRESADATTDTAWLLHRYRHREQHLDAIGAVLAGSRSGNAPPGGCA